MGTHECVFPEEQEPSGRLILAPCLVCGCTALDALEQLRAGAARSDRITVPRELLADLVRAAVYANGRGITDPEVVYAARDLLARWDEKETNGG